MVHEYAYFYEYIWKPVYFPFMLSGLRFIDVFYV